METTFIKIGHRGARGYITENTIESIAKAIELGVDAIEIDVQRCKTGEIIVFHDYRVDRLTNSVGRISELSLKQIRSLKLENGSLIPTLEEVLDFIDNKVILNIEIKGEDAAPIVCKTINRYTNTSNWDLNNFLISSFNHNELVYCKKLFPLIRTGVLLACIPTDYAKIAKNIDAYSINLSLEFINQDFINDAHKRGLKVFVYTVNDYEDIKIMKNLGVDGIFCDFPDRL